MIRLLGKAGALQFSSLDVLFNGSNEVDFKLWEQYYFDKERSVRRVIALEALVILSQTLSEELGEN